jgi:PhnB protein
MTKAVKPIPEGVHTVTPYLIVRGADRALDFYQKAFGAQETVRMPSPDGKIMHAEFRIGDSVVFLSEEAPNMGSVAPKLGTPTPISLHLYVEDVDAAYKRAVAAGAKGEMPPADMFWGDRFSKVSDPFGHAWSIATVKEQLTPEEMGKRAQAFFAEMAKQAGSQGKA